MLDHACINVSNLAPAKAFYERALAPLDITVQLEFEGVTVGFGRGGRSVFWLIQREPVTGGAHLAFTAPDQATVDAFHTAAMEAGATDHGAPGLRPQYHDGYYGAFVLDPDGHNIEAVCHLPA